MTAPEAAHTEPLRPPDPARTDAARQVLGLSRLIQLEGELRQADSPRSIDFIAVNDTNRVVAYDHALIWRARSGAVAAVSGGLIVDRHAPQIVWFGKAARHVLTAAVDKGATVEIDKDTLPNRLHRGLERWVAGAGLVAPLLGPHGAKEGGLIVLRADAFNESERRILARIGGAIGHAIAAIEGPRRRFRLGFKPLAGAAVIAACAAGVLPVPMTVLAEAKVTPIDPTIVAAPLDGVIKTILVESNDVVPEGRSLVQFDPTELEAQRDVAAKHVAVLTADWQRLEQKAFADDKARADISVARSRLSEGESDLAYAIDKLRRADVKASNAGVVMIEDRNQWLGRPVKIGERILSLADPNKVRLEIQVPVEDALVATPGAKIEFFLAIAPAKPVAAQLTRMSYEARLLPNQTSAFTGEAAFEDDAGLPRLGLTGTAKIYGEPVPLAYALLRRPLAHLRRVLGF